MAGVDVKNKNKIVNLYEVRFVSVRLDHTIERELSCTTLP